METELIAYADGDDQFDVMVARPEGTGPHLAIIVCHAWAGRDDFYEGKARALAELGYVGAAIDLYGVGKRGHDKASCQALMMPLIDEPARLRRRLNAAYQAVRDLPGVTVDRMGVIGYCFGGLCAILYARMGLPLRAAVSFHGLLKLGEPLDAPCQAKLLVLHGQDDPMVSSAELGVFAEEMKRIGADWQLHAYPGIMHAFTNPKANDPEFGTLYDPDTDRRSWLEMQGFLKDNL